MRPGGGELEEGQVHEATFGVSIRPTPASEAVRLRRIRFRAAASVWSR